MPRTMPALAIALIAVALATSPTPGRPDDPKDKEAPKLTEGFVRFRIQEVDTTLKVGYAVCVADVNGDGKPDIVVADTDRVVWYENPTWQRRTMIENKYNPETGAVIEKRTEPDNVSIAAAMIDGKAEFALAAGWTGKFDSKAPGTLQWLRRGKSLDEPWEVIPIPCTEPSVHRVRIADLTGEGKPQLIVAPLMGLGATRTGNWMERPVKILSYKIPADPVKGPWTPEVIDEKLHVVHGICPVPTQRPGADLLVASYEGLTLLFRDAAGHWTNNRLADGNQKTPLGFRGSSEVKVGKLKGGTKFVATVEPWHGNQVVVYTQGADTNKSWDRKVLDERMRGGHAVWCADLDGDGSEEIIVGVRDDPAQGEMHSERRGIRIYRSADSVGRKWERTMPDEGGVAVEDLCVADLNGDGRPDIIAVGRQTGNLKIYWNTK